MRQAYLTVTGHAPFTVGTVGPPPPDAKKKYDAELEHLLARMQADDPKLDTAQAAWEASTGHTPQWTLLGQTKMKPITGWWSILRPLVLMGLGIRK